MWLTIEVDRYQTLEAKRPKKGLDKHEIPPFLFWYQFGLGLASPGLSSYERMSLQNINVLYGVTTTEAHLSLIKTHISYPPIRLNPRTQKASKRFWTIWTPCETPKHGPTPSDPVGRQSNRIHSLATAAPRLFRQVLVRVLVLRTQDHRHPPPAQ